MLKNYTWFLLLSALTIWVPDIRAQQPVATYDFNGNANDISDTKNNASIRGALLTQDRFGVANSAFLFDGEQSAISAPNSPALQTPTTSISFWVRVDELPGQGEVFLLSNGGWQERWKISLPSHGKPVFTTNHENGISDMDSGDGNNLQEGVWTHLVMVHDGAKDNIYFNGVLAGEKDVVGNLNSTGHPLGIGYDPIDGVNYFKGAMDDIIIYDGALDATQVADLYAAQNMAPVFSTGVVASYSFNGDLLDNTSYGNHAKGTDTWFTTDRFGFGEQSLAFNGTSSECTAANSAQLNSPWTSVAFWINVNALPGNGEAFVASFGGWQERWKISLPSHGKLVWTTNHENGISDMDAGDANVLVPNTWTHVVCVHSMTGDLIYVNGALAAQKDFAGALNSTTHPLGLGYNPIDGGNFLDGMLDEFAIYNSPLTAQDIADLYAAQSTTIIDPNPVVADFTFSGNTEDASQFANHARADGGSSGYDRFGYASSAYHLDGNSSLSADNSVQYNTDYTTVSFWVNLDELPGNGEVFLLSHGGWQERWKISLPSHGKPVWTTNHSGGISDMDSGDGNALVPGVWTHVVTSHGPVSDKIYINGALAAEKAVGNPLNHTTYPLGIGYNPIDGGNYTLGSFDEVRIYNRDLTDQEVMDLYNEQNTAPVFFSEVVADYTFDGNLNDLSEYHNHAHNAGAVSTKDRFDRANHAMEFNGGAEVTADNSPQLNSPLATVAFWVKPNSLPGNGEAFLLSFGGWQERYKISLPTHGKPVWTTNHENGISDMDSGDGNELPVGEWTHVAFVHDGAKDLIYINGQLAAEKDVVGLLNNTTHPLGIGYNPIDGGSYFDGAIDEVLIFNIALTALGVEQLYNDQSQDPMETDQTPPNAPVNLAASVNFTNVDLTWWASSDDDSGLAGYNVFVDGELVQTVVDPSASINDLAPLTEYEMGVTAVDFAGNESTMSTLLVTTGMDETPDVTPPSTPMNLVIAPGANSVVFSWDASTDDTGVAGYVVFVDGDYVDTLAGTQTSIFIGGLDPSTLYTFEVYAFDFAGNDSEIADITESTTEPIDTGEPGLVAHYPFEGNANDATPYNNHGAIGGNPTFQAVTGRPNAAGQSIVFDGEQDSVLVPNAVQLISDFATVSFWIRVDGQNLADAEAYLIDFGHWSQRWKISLPQHLKPVWTTNGKNAQFDNFISDMDSGDGNELVVGFWWYVTMVHDGTDDIIYVDGVEANRKPVNSVLNSTAFPLGMGNNPIEGGQYFEGSLDEVKLYNKALTGAEIAQLYETGTTGIGQIPTEIHKYVELLYPNPTTDELVIKHGFTTSQKLLIRVFDTAGRQVQAQNFSSQEVDGNLLRMNVADLNTGIYSLNFVLGGKNLGSIPFSKQ